MPDAYLKPAVTARRGDGRRGMGVHDQRWPPTRGAVYRAGRRDLLLEDPNDLDACQEVIGLIPEEADALADVRR